MTTCEPHNRAPDGPLAWDAGCPDPTEQELRAKARALRAKARALRALAQSALATGTADETVREYLNAVMAFAGRHAGD